MGCGRRPNNERVDVKTSLLPEVAAETKELSTYQPAKPYAALNNGVLARTVFQTDGPAGYHVDVQDWQVPAGKQADGSSLAGGAIVEVRSGTGSLQSGGQKNDLALGAVTSIPQGQAFTIANTGQVPLILRLYVVSAR
jgi:hypothetical protein